MNLSEIAILNYPNLPRRRIKFFLRVLLNGKKPITKIERIFNHPKLRHILDKNPSQYTKIYRPYLYRGLKIDERILSVNNHYEFIKKHWHAKLIKGIYSEVGMTLATMQLEENIFSIKIEQCSGTRYENESELIISLFSQEEKVMGICFNFTIDENGGGGIFMSSMQGSSNRSHKEHNQLIKEFTKKMKGMRPQAFLIFALTVFASLYDLKKIIAVSTHSHLKSKRIKTNYDSFWSDFGGELINDNLYSIPLTYQRKSIESIPSKKRGMYKQRYSLLDNIEEQIRQAMRVEF